MTRRPTVPAVLPFPVGTDKEGEATAHTVGLSLRIFRRLHSWGLPASTSGRLRAPVRGNRPPTRSVADGRPEVFKRRRLPDRPTSLPTHPRRTDPQSVQDAARGVLRRLHRPNRPSEKLQSSHDDSGGNRRSLLHRLPHHTPQSCQGLVLRSSIGKYPLLRATRAFLRGPFQHQSEAAANLRQSFLPQVGRK